MPHPTDWKPGDKIDSPVDSMEAIDFDTLSARDAYRLIISTIIPRPIAFVSTICPKGVVNLAPFSFFNGVSSNPPCIIISIAPRADGGQKDTLRNIQDTKQFVVNSANEWLIEPLVHCGGEFPSETSELQVTGLTPIPSVKIKPPRVQEAAVHMECELHSLVPIGNGDPGSTTLVIGRILMMHIASHIKKDGRVQPDALRPVARLGGISYATLGEKFDIPIPPIGNRPGRTE